MLRKEGCNNHLRNSKRSVGVKFIMPNEIYVIKIIKKWSLLKHAISDNVAETSNGASRVGIIAQENKHGH